MISRPSQVLYQAKTFFTCIFAWLCLHKRLTRVQWLAVIGLVIGTILASDVGLDARNSSSSSSRSASLALRGSQMQKHRKDAESMQNMSDSTIGKLIGSCG